VKLAVAIFALAGCDQLFGLQHLRDAAPLVEALPDSFDDGLVAHFTFDDATWSDATGNGHTGACAGSGCPTIVPGHIKSAASFDGVDDHVDVATASDLGTAAAFTVALWLHVDTDMAQGCPINKLHAGTDYDGYQLCIDNEVMGFYTVMPTDPGVKTGTLLTPNIWHHVALRHHDQDNSMFVDGVEVGVAVGITDIDSAMLMIGADLDGGSVLAFYGGLVDDLRIYNRELTGSDIAMIASQ
jgi:hypothetical protein